MLWFQKYIFTVFAKTVQENKAVKPNGFTALRLLEKGHASDFCIITCCQAIGINTRRQIAGIKLELIATGLKLAIQKHHDLLTQCVVDGQSNKL